MQITAKEAGQIAGLARLELSAQEQALYASQLGAILDWVAVLDKAPAGEMEPVAQVTGLENVTRADRPEPAACRAEILSLLPQREYDFVKVPKVIE